mmetsp:Transcript_47802/g.133285  ORF Transcript_47802/g.133285 Transcript_47802/m.133285 type:complete len:203 (-) Transcript_47802:1071-1679(-)
MESSSSVKLSTMLWTASLQVLRKLPDIDPLQSRTICIALGRDGCLDACRPRFHLMPWMSCIMSSMIVTVSSSALTFASRASFWTIERSMLGTEFKAQGRICWSSCRYHPAKHSCTRAEASVAGRSTSTASGATILMASSNAFCTCSRTSDSFPDKTYAMRARLCHLPVFVWIAMASSMYSLASSTSSTSPESRRARAKPRQR